MKYRILLKDPDGVSNAMYAAAKESTANSAGLSDDELDNLKEDRREQLEEHAEKWIQYGEYLTVEIDTEANTCIVIPRK